MKTIDKQRGRRRIYFAIVILVLALLSFKIYDKNKDRKLNEIQPTHAIAQSVEIQAPVSVPVIEPVPEPTVEPIVQQSVPTQAVEPTPEPIVVPVANNEQIAWDYLINQGYSRIAVAGIMGNLRQEHNFQTSAHPNGLGIAQWTSGRRALLETRPNYEDINVQLDYMIFELNGAYSMVRDGLHTATTVEEATLVFMNDFERCGDCRENQRVQYAYEILARH